MKQIAYVVAFERGPYGNDNYQNVVPWVCGSELFLKREDAETCCAADKLRNPGIQHKVIEMHFEIK